MYWIYRLLYLWRCIAKFVYKSDVKYITGDIMSFFWLKSGFWTILKDFEFAVYCSLYKKDKGGTLVLKGLQRWSGFFPENHIAPLSIFTAKRSNDSRFSSYFPIENLSKRPGASLRRKLKSHNFWTVKMRSKINTCQWEIVPLIYRYRWSKR